MADDEALARQLQDALFLQVKTCFIHPVRSFVQFIPLPKQEMQADPRFRSEVQGIFNEGGGTS